MTDVVPTSAFSRFSCLVSWAITMVDLGFTIGVIKDFISVVVSMSFVVCLPSC